MASLDVFEVDHPASQAWKRARVAELGIPVPARQHHVAIDFERTTLADGLAETAVDRGRHMFISMLGVAQYLTKGALARTLNFKSAYWGLQPRIGYEFDDLGRTVRVSKI